MRMPGLDLTGAWHRADIGKIASGASAKPAARNSCPGKRQTLPAGVRESCRRPTEPQRRSVSPESTAAVDCQTLVEARNLVGGRADGTERVTRRVLGRVWVNVRPPRLGCRPALELEGTCWIGARTVGKTAPPTDRECRLRRAGNGDTLTGRVITPRSGPSPAVATTPPPPVLRASDADLFALRGAVLELPCIEIAR